MLGRTARQRALMSYSGAAAPRKRNCFRDRELMRASCVTRLKFVADVGPVEGPVPCR